MTNAQKRAIERIRTAVLEHDGHGDGYEYKRFEVSEIPDTSILSVITEVGLVGDKGTMAAIFARIRRHLFVGPRGGLTLVNAAKFIKASDGKLTKDFAANVKGHRALWASSY